jgi:hypothetical protein
MALHKLVFDATDADSRLASANVGAYLRASDGTLLTHTDVGGKKALDVRVAEGINVEVDLDAADDSVAAWLSDGSGNAITSTTGSLNVNLTNTSIAVTATDLDIRDLAFATDSVDVSGSEVSLDSATLAALENITVSATDLDIRDLAFATDSVDVSGSEVSLDSATLAALETITVNQGTSPWVIGDGGGSITVDATDLDIRDLTAATDSIDSWLNDGAGNAITSTAGALDVNIASGTLSINDAALADTAIRAVAETVGTTIGQIVDGGDELASRKYLYVYNNGNKDTFIGQTGITTATGFPIPPGAILEARIGAAVDVYMIASAANQNVRTLQLS